MVGHVEPLAPRVEHRREGVAGADGDVVRREGAHDSERAVLQVTGRIESVAKRHAEVLDRPAVVGIGLMVGSGGRKVGAVAVEGGIVQEGHPLAGGVVDQVAADGEFEPHTPEEVP